MKEQMEEKMEGRWQRRIYALLTVLLILAVVLCLYVVIQVLSKGYANLGGFMMFRVVSGSMEPTISTGALLIAREADIMTIQLNDIICFRTQLSEIWGRIVTHRVTGVMQSEAGTILLETKGDANLVSDIFLVDESNLIGKVVWYTGEGSVLAGMLSVFTDKIVFLSCIVLPTLIISALIMKDSVAGIRRDMLLMLEEERRQESRAQAGQDDPLCGMTQEEYDEMYERIRSELMEELTQIYDQVSKEQEPGGESAGTE